MIPRAKGRFDGIEQSGVAEWLEQAGHGSLTEQPWTKRFVALRRDEDNRNRRPATNQFLLKIRPAHARQSDVEDQAVRAAGRQRVEECFCRRERLDRKTGLFQQIGQRLPY